jgi:hypothetical protein
MVASAKRIVLIAAVALVVAACQGGAADTTTSTTGSSLVELPPPPTTLVEVTTTTLAPIDELSAPEYQIVKRVPGEGAGDELVVLLDPTSYETLTDIDIQDLIAEVVEFFPPVSILHVVDDPAAVNIVGNPEATPEEIESIEVHYLARLDNGVEITYLGPFSESGSGVLGS